MADKKYYWLKLKRDFFKRHDVRIIEELPNGKEYLLFYLKLLVESIDHEGELRFSDTIPYNEQMLSVITNTNIDVVRSAMKLFVELKMIEVLADETIYLAEVSKMIGSAADNDGANRVRRFREKKKLEALPSVTGALQNVTVSVTEDNESKSIELEKEIDKEKEVNKPQKRFIKPTIEEVKAYCQERNKGVDAEKWYNHYEANGWKCGRTKMVDWKAAIRTWERSEVNGKPKSNNFTPYPDEY